MRLVFHFVESSVSNAFIIHKEVQMQHLTNKDFRRIIYYDLLVKQIVTTESKKSTATRHVLPKSNE